MKNNTNIKNLHGLTFLLLAALFVAPGYAALTPGGAVGPVVPAGIGKGFPAWYMDQNGLAVELMEAADGFGISDPVDPANPDSVEIGINAEGFYWSADAIPADAINTINGAPISSGLVLALEAAFAGEAAVDGEQSVFGRVRYQVDGLIIGETYTIRHPFGTVTEIAEDADGNGPGLIGRIRVVDDIGCFGVPDPATGLSSCNPAVSPLAINNFNNVLNSGIGPFLTWDTFNINPALSDPLLVNPANPGKRYIGNSIQEHAIKGSPVGQNFFRVEGPGIPNGFLQTNLFTVTGRIAVIDTIAPVIGATSPANAVVGSTNVVATVQVTDDLGVRTVTIDLGPLGSSLSATINGAQEVLPSSTSTATGTGTFTIDTNANTLTFDISFSGLPAGDIEQTSHIHNAAAGANGPHLFDLPASTITGGVSRKTGVWNYGRDIPAGTDPETVEAEILAGRTYVQIHSLLFPSGAIRGQILPTTNVQTMLRTSGTLTAGTWSIVIPSVTRLGTFNLPIVATDGSNTVNGVFTLNVIRPLASVSVAPAPASIVVGGTQQLTASPLDSTGAQFAGTASVTWSSGNTAVATVNTAGLVTAVAPGTATITATATSGAVSVTGTSAVTVTPVAVLTTINIAPSIATLTAVGVTQQLTATGLDQLNAPIATGPLTWASNTPAVATVSPTGLVTAVAPGTATITVTGGSVSGTATINVIQLTSVSVTPSTGSVLIGSGGLQMTASPLDNTGAAFSGATVSWSSSNTAVATVNAAGLVTAVAAGTSTITATATSGSVSVTGTSAITVSVCETGADANADGAIGNLEILNYVRDWKAGSVTNLNVLKAVRFWKSGTGC